MVRIWLKSWHSSPKNGKPQLLSSIFRIYGSLLSVTCPLCLVGGSVWIDITFPLLQLNSFWVKKYILYKVQGVKKSGKRCDRVWYKVSKRLVQGVITSGTFKVQQGLVQGVKNSGTRCDKACYKMTIVGPQWDHTGTVVGPYWDRSGTVVGS